MKKSWLTYSNELTSTPITPWVDDGQRYGWVNERAENGQWRRPKRVRTAFQTQLKQWCVLEVDYLDVRLVFALPTELDNFIEIMSTNPLPSGPSLLKGQKFGRPNKHWLSRLPAKAKSLKFRQAICKWLGANSDVENFRQYYRDRPLQRKYEGVYSSSDEALAAQEA